MYDIRTLHRSFAAGEITPEMHGRIDHVKYQTGLALAKNFITLPHGPAINRPGTRFIGPTKAANPATRLVAFHLTDGTGYLLEFGHQYIRFWYGGGRVLASGNSVAIDSWQWSGNGHTLTSASHGLTNGTAVFLSGVMNQGQPVSTPGVFYVSDATTDTFRLRAGSPTGPYYNYKSNFFAWPFADLYSGGSVTEVSTQPYELATPYNGNDLWTLRFSQSAGVMTITAPGYAPRELRITAPNNWSLTQVDFDSPVTAPTASVLAGKADGVTQDSISAGYVVTAVDADGNESEPSNIAQIQNDLWNAGNYNVISWTQVTGADRYNVYKAESNGSDWSAFFGKAFGYIGTSDGINLIDQNIVPDYSRCPPENQSLFESAGDFPRVSTYFEQRRIFASTENQPQHVWATRSGSDSNMSRPIPPQEDSPLTFRIAANAAFAVQHIVALDELLLFTDAAVWRVFARDNGALSPFNVTARQTASIGASVQASPIVADTRVLFVEAKSSHVIELSYSVSTDRVGYSIEDASLLATHLFDGYQVTHLAYSTQPYKIIWATRSDGALLGMTYLPGQDVRGWHQHHTATSAGASRVFDVCVVPEAGDADGIYLLVQREINGVLKVYIEKLELSRPATLADAFYVDCGLSYEGVVPATTFSGLDHLEGEPVVALADGIVVEDLVVVGGEVTLPFEATKVHIGLPIVADLKTLPAYNDPAVNGIGTVKNVNKVRLLVNESSHLLAGPSFDRLREYEQRTDELMGEPPRLISGLVSIDIDPEWNEHGQVCVRQDMPLPVMISAIVQEVALGD